ncbi:MAG: amidohydrolase family protein [Candidatus Aminicenantes bacterium]|nr:MAG: amidohydrolase family protein [Candidatus Aminicenantes bacterium]
MKNGRWVLVCFLVVTLLYPAFYTSASIFQDSEQEAEKKPGHDKKSDIIVIKGGTIHTISKGVIHQGMILIADGKIQKVGKNLVPPEGAFVLDAKDKRVMPGFIVSQSYTIGMGAPVRNDKNPKLIHYLDPYSLDLRLCLASGITAYSPFFFIGTGPMRKNYSFVNAVIKPAYGKLEDMLIKQPAYLYIDMIRLKPSEKNELRGFFQQARDHIEKENDYEANKEIKKGKPPVASPQIANFVAVLKGELPVRFNASRKKEILKTLAFVDEFSMQAQIVGAGEGWLLPEEIGRRNIATILQPEAFIPPDPYAIPSNGSNIRNAQIQKENGIKFAVLNSYPYIRPGGTIGTDLMTFPLAGAYAIRGGLDEKDALKAITLWPAELLGISHRVGSIEEGKDADIIILDGNPFDYRTYVDYTLINGKILYDKSKSSLFKYIPKPKKIF